MRTHTRLAASLAVALTAFVACGDDDLESNPRRDRAPATDAGAEGGTTDPGLIPFEPVGPTVYVPKVKNLLTGLAATDEEVQAVIADPNALRPLIDKWMGLPSFKTRMLDFMRNAFQQNQVTLDTLNSSLNLNLIMNGDYTPRLMRNIMDSFPLTVWKLLEEGRPFTEAFTTRRYMMTTAMLSLLTYVDDQHWSDARKLDNRLSARNALSTYTFDTALTTSTDDSLDPGKPTFMKFKFPGAQPAGCSTTAVSYTQTGDNPFYARLFNFFMGRAPFDPCEATANDPNLTFAPQYREEDWDDWHMVEIHVDGASSGASPAFFQLPQLRAAKDITLRTDRLGFFGTLAFDTNWATNVTNEARVTANQSLIVGIGRSIEGEDVIANFPVDATDADHAANPACLACHRQLDPYKQFFRNSWTLYYSQQGDPLVANTPAGFAFEGVTQSGKGVSDLGAIFAAHPRVPVAWTSKLAFWANSTPVIESDPEVLRVAKAFSDASFDFKTLVRETFASPLVTWASATETTQTKGVILSIARRDQFCASLSYRLGLDDVCGMLTTKPTNTQRTVQTRALMLPVDGYYRSAALPALPTNPDLFFRQSTESICKLVSDQIIDVKAPATGKYVSTDPATAIEDLVSTVMGIVPSDPRHGPAKAILQDNFDQSKAGGANASDSLKATFQLACLSPTSVVIGL